MLFSQYLDHPSATITFSTRFVGELRVTRSGDWLTLDFPAWTTTPVDNPPADLLAGLGLESAVEVREGRDYLVVLADRQQVGSGADRYGTSGRSSAK